ncbi:Hpt domain-containing protein [Thiomicrorhabdus aquaedulcis]|uniref:Hpt domain-containing protein n=1 Tax=Thiomicrorhabdus aquaedulcis TaxID=2211106 RepID=UPI000FD9EF36|nr:Hpt domain-containing protein [Thiomicrorhabdus aquaedulcis]
MATPVDVSNLEMLKEVIGDDLKDILQSYLETTPDLIQKISTAITMENAANLQLHAHTLKGSSANIGAVQLPVTCQQLEKLAKEGTINAQSKELFAQINIENREVNQFLSSYINTF